MRPQTRRAPLTCRRAAQGPSGSGKTTLLNSLACRLDKGSKMSGELRLNGKKYSMHDLKQHAGYVMQDDLLNGNLTVLETLKYTAELRLPRSTTAAERMERINTVMQQMGLTKVQDVIIGTPLKKGISGGERKRLCVAMELLTKPLLLFLDGASRVRERQGTQEGHSLSQRRADARTACCAWQSPPAGWTA
jgi:ATP-binding cassette subfamily G (WHITE) protein 2